MRIHQVRMLVWELVWRDRLGFLTATLLVPLVALILNRLLKLFPQLPDITPFLPLLFFLCLIYFVVIFCYSQFSSQTFETGFPRHVMQLPVPTWLISIVPLGFAIAFLYAYIALWTTYILNLKGFQFHSGYTLVGVTIGVSWLQTLSWGLNKTPVRAMIILLGVCVTTILSMLILTSDSKAPLLSPSLAMMTLFALMVTGPATAYLSVQRARKGQTIGHLIKLSEINWSLVSLERHFKSAAKAQFWYEWRIFGWLLPFAAILIGLMLFFMQWLPTDINDRLNATLLAIGMFIYITTVSGHSFSKPYFTASTLQMGSFWATRPLSCMQLAHAKLNMAACNVFLSILILLVFIIAGMNVEQDDNWGQKVWNWLVDHQGLFNACLALIAATGVLISIAWSSCAVGLSIFIAGNKKTNRTISFIASVALVTIILLSTYIKIPQPVPPTLGLYGSIILSLLLLGLLILTIHLSTSIKETNLIQQLKIPAGVSLAFLSVTTYAIWQFDLNSKFGIMLNLFSANLSLISFLPFLAAPVALTKNRHR